MGNGRPKMVGPTKKELDRIERARKQHKSIKLGETDFDMIDMSSKNTYWTDEMSRSVFVNSGKVENSSKPIRESLILRGSKARNYR